MASVEIELRRRTDDWHAQLRDDPEHWGTGPTPDHALGNLLIAWPELFGAKITLLDD